MTLAHEQTAAEELRVREAQAGNATAFAELVETHGPAVEHLALRILRDRDDAFDAAQDTWIHVAANLTSLRDVRRFQPWLRQIARNSSFDVIRRRARWNSFAWTDDQMDAVADETGATPEQHLLSWDNQRSVWEVLGQLSTADRSILHLWGQGLRHAEIAQRLGITSHTAEVRVSRARERFRAKHHATEHEDTHCRVSSIDLAVFAEGGLDEQERSVVQVHLARCGACEQRVTAMRNGRRLYRAFGPFFLPEAFRMEWATQAHALLAKARALAGIGAGGASSAAGGTAAAAGTTAVATAGFTIGPAAISGVAALVLIAATAGTGAAALGFMPPDARPALAVRAPAAARVADGPTQVPPSARSTLAGGEQTEQATAPASQPAPAASESPGALPSLASETPINGNGTTTAGTQSGLTAPTIAPASSDVESVRQQQESDRRAAEQQRASDAESAQQQAESDAASADQQAASDAESAQQQAESDAASADQQAASDAESARQQAESDAASADQQAASDTESTRQQAESDAHVS